MANAYSSVEGLRRELQPEQDSGSSRTRSTRNPRDIAIQHALVLEHRKQVEAQILENLISLSEYPLCQSPSHSAANPAPSDVADFKHRVRLFQPSDYDDLVLERNANGRCGYALCSKPKPRASAGGAWKLVGVASKNFDIVHRKEHEKWCSSFCRRRALYIRVQLNETAAWERVGIPDIDIDIPQDSTEFGDKSDSGIRRDQAKAAEDAATLAIERGDSKTGPRVEVTLRPKEIIDPPTAIDPDALEYEEGHLVLEGYSSKTALNT
jgi:hypothetical protein